MKNEAKEEEYALLHSRLMHILSSDSTDPTMDLGDNTISLQQADAFQTRLEELAIDIANLKQHVTEILSPRSHEQASTPRSVEPDDMVSDALDEKVQAKERGRECVRLLIPLLTSSLRHARYVCSRMIAVKFLTDLTSYMDDDTILQFILPYLIYILREKEAMKKEEELSLEDSLKKLTTLSGGVNDMKMQDAEEMEQKKMKEKKMMEREKKRRMNEEENLICMVGQ